MTQNEWLAAALGVSLSIVCAIGSLAQTGPKPAFVPGLYETESRHSASEARGVKRKTCIASPDFDAFRRETIERYLELPQFKSVCKLSDSKPLADGFAFAMDCGQAKTIIRYRFTTNLVSSTVETKVAGRPENDSTILTLSRRIGPCTRANKPGADL